MSWPLPRADAHNSGRSAVRGSFRSAPRERWSLDTGGEVRAIRVVRSHSEALIVVLAGTVLSAFDRLGHQRWALPRSSVSRFVAAGDLDATGAGCLLVRTDTRTLMLIDASTGDERWRWRSDAGTFINDHAGVVVVPRVNGSRIVLCPTYAPWIIAFDLAGEEPPTLAWRRDGPWDAGFGPSVIAADLHGDGTTQLVLSSRVGSSARTVDGVVATDKLVLGRRRGLLYQAVHDIESGEPRDMVSYAPDRHGRRVARPYGLLTARALAPGEPASIVLASCQVEEYLAVTRRRRDGRLERAWGHFVEKDWPRDDRELRIVPGALVDLRGEGRPELLVSLWQDGRWVSRIVDPRRSWAAARAELPDRVIWGTVRDRGGQVSLVTSIERARETGAATTLELLGGHDLSRAGHIPDGTLIVDETGPLPIDTAFMARRRGAATVDRPDGSTGVAVVRWRGSAPQDTVLWSPAAEPERLIAGAAVRVDAHEGLRMATRAGGTVELSDADGGHGRVVARGRSATVLSVALGDERALIVGVADDTLRWLRPARRSPRWGGSVPGRVASASAGVLYVGQPGRPWMLAAWPVTGRGGPRWRIPLSAPLDHPVLPLPGGRIALTLRTGVHTLATEIRDGSGALVARVPVGAYLHPPALLDNPVDPLLLLDDHGILVALDMDGHERWRRDWTAAYSLPITGQLGPAGRVGILRANGIHGVAALDRAGRTRWRRSEPLWRLAAGRGAIIKTPDGPALAMPTRDGRLEAVLTGTGSLRWSLALGVEVEHASVTAGDLDGDGRDELLVGLADGRLLAVGEDGGRPAVRWSVDLGAGVTDAWLTQAGDEPVIVACTSDGAVRLLAAS